MRNTWCQDKSFPVIASILGPWGAGSTRALAALQICQTVQKSTLYEGLILSRKTSTSAAIATGGGREDLHVHVGGGRENEIFSFKEELGMPSQKESCCQQGGHGRALQLRGQLLQRGGVGEAGEHCRVLQRRRNVQVGKDCHGRLLDMGAKAKEVAKAPLTPCSWVSEGSQCCLFIVDFLWQGGGLL